MKTLAALLLASFLLVGCGGLEKKIVGSWKVDTAKTVMTGDAVKDAEMKKMVMSMMSTISLDIKEDKTFEMKVIMPITGTWALTGNKLVLTPNKEKGESFSFGGKETMDFTVDGSGNSMSTTIEDKQNGGTLVMVKSEAAK